MSTSELVRPEESAILPDEIVSTGRMAGLLCGATVSVSAFLLFLVQPILGKIILPWFGGSAGVWTTCLVYFQASLLAGYLYAHCVRRYLRSERQVQIHILLLAASLLLLPILPSNSKTVSGTFSLWERRCRLRSWVG